MGDTRTIPKPACIRKLDLDFYRYYEESLTTAERMFSLLINPTTSGIQIVRLEKKGETFNACEVVENLPLALHRAMPNEGDGLYLPLHDTLLRVNPEYSAETAWATLDQFVKSQLDGAGSVCVHNIDNTFGKLYHIAAGERLRLLNPQFKTYNSEDRRLDGKSTRLDYLLLQPEVKR